MYSYKKFTEGYNIIVNPPDTVPNTPKTPPCKLSLTTLLYNVQLYKTVDLLLW